MNRYDKTGMRCQMCLFDESTCTPDSLWHAVNIFLILFILGSAGLTSMLLVKFWRDRSGAKQYVVTEEDDFVARMVQIGALCVATLPFSTGVFFIGREQLGGVSYLVYVLCGMPCALGWFCALLLLFWPLIAFEESTLINEREKNGERSNLNGAPFSNSYKHDSPTLIRGFRT